MDISCTNTQLVHARDARIAQQRKDTFGATSDVSPAHDLRQAIEMNRDSCVEKTRWATSSSRLATLLAREHAGENRRVRLNGQNETIAGAMYSPRLLKEVLTALGKQLVDDGRLGDWTASVCTQPDHQQTFLSWTHKNGKKTISISKESCSTQSRSRKKKREEIDWVLKQKLFGYVSESECAERQVPPHSLNWVLKNKGEKVRARLVVREIKKAKSEEEKLEPSDVFSAMPPVV